MVEATFFEDLRNPLRVVTPRRMESGRMENGERGKRRANRIASP